MMRFIAILLVLLLTLTACAGRKPVPTTGAESIGSTKNTKSTKTPPLKTTTYKVQKGDTLYSISWRAGMDYKTLAKINNIKAPYTIYAGQKLTLQSSKTTTKPSSTTSKKPATKTTATTKKTTSKKPAPKTEPSNKNLVWQWPTSGKVISTYSKSATGRKGIDIAGKEGQKVVAAAVGRVVYSGNGLPRYGNLIIIKHNDVYLSAYAHNKTLLVKEGQQIKAGQKIALMGHTGAQKTQLHFEVRRNGKPVDPLRFLPKR